MDNITRFIIRYLKEKKVYTILLNNKYRRKFVESFIHTINPYQFFRTIAMRGLVKSSYFDDFTRIFDYELYHKHYFSKIRNIAIINVKDYYKFKNFLNKNGIIWCNDRVFNNDDVERYNNANESYYFMFDINDSCKLYHGRYDGNNVTTIYESNHRIILEEEEFYECYNKMRKELSNNILSYLRKNKFKIN